MWGLKLGLAAAIFGVGYFGGVMPLRLRREEVGERAIACGNALAAGIFLGSGMIHLLPEASAGWRALGFQYPVASVLAATGFTLVLLLEHGLLSDAAHSATHVHVGETPTHDGHHSHGGSDEASVRVLVLALSAHSVLAGIALGMTHEFASISMMALAIVFHKAPAGFALGVTLLRRDQDLGRARRVVAWFASMTPMGVIVGLWVGGLLRPAHRLLFDSTVTALVAGVFLYIGAFDLVQDEGFGSRTRRLKWLSAVVGISLAAVIALLGAGAG